MSERQNKQTCGHLECGEYLGRLEYCETTANTVGEAASLTIDMVEELLYNKARMAQGSLQYTGDNASRCFERQFSFLHTTANAPLLRTTVAITHSKDRELHDVYTIEAAWQSYHANIKGRFVTRYVLESWPGVVQSTLSEYDSDMSAVLTGREPSFTDRTMNSYDHEQLFSLLSTVYDVCAPRTQDNLAETV